ncbi:DNA repair protein RecO [Candidatus Clavichlamydia salmonicola]|uniref:DNA repair protein RecO n=1 Tax=Candidatus Clavichlamydia salmonicola TaxID=469812 RepID=UPI001890E139|nr:DNA repair protein RecO [Candidatus Clavichlamydia salmonicola]
MFITIEAIVLSSLPLNDQDSVILLFSENGLFRIFVKNGKKYQSAHATAITPLTKGLYTYRYLPGKMMRLEEAKVINHNLHLRKDFETLSTALSLTDALSSSQFLGKPAPYLYQLFISFLEKISLIPDPSILKTTFLLKIIKHEGALQLEPICYNCEKHTSPTFRFAGYIFCKYHAFTACVSFEKNEEIFLQTLALSRSFAQLADLSLFKENLFDKVSILFDQTISKEKISSSSDISKKLTQH